jgi:hypothetical protein
MAEQTSFVREGFGRVSSAFERLDEEFQRVQREIQKRRKTFERQLASGRRDIERRTRRQVQRLRTELRRLPLARRVERLRAGAERAFDRGVDTFLGALQIASKNDLERIDRKLGQMSRKLKEIERTRGNGHASSG